MNSVFMLRSPPTRTEILVRVAKSAGTGARALRGKLPPQTSLVSPSRAPFQDSGVFMSRVPPVLAFFKRGFPPHKTPPKKKTTRQADFAKQAAVLTAVSISSKATWIRANCVRSRPLILLKLRNRGVAELMCDIAIERKVGEKQ